MSRPAVLKSRFRTADDAGTDNNTRVARAKFGYRHPSHPSSLLQHGRQRHGPQGLVLSPGLENLELPPALVLDIFLIVLAFSHSISIFS